MTNALRVTLGRRRWLVTFSPTRRGLVRVRRLRDSYAGIAGGVYGRNAEERAAYICTERESWERSPTDRPFNS